MWVCVFVTVLGILLFTSLKLHVSDPEGPRPSPITCSASLILTEIWTNWSMHSSKCVLQISWHTCEIPWLSANSIIMYMQEVIDNVGVIWCFYDVLLHVVKDMQISAPAADARAQSPASGRLRSVLLLFNYNYLMYSYTMGGKDGASFICMITLDSATADLSWLLVIMATVKRTWKYVLEEHHLYSARWKGSGGISTSICRQSWDCTKH